MNFASLISRIFEPMLVLVALTIDAVSRSGLSKQDSFRFLLVLFFGLCAPIVAARFFLIKTHRVSNWDISKRAQRIKPLIVLVAYLSLFFLILVYFQNAFLIRYYALLYFWIIGFFILNLFQKISGHIGILTLSLLLIIHWNGFVWWPVFITIPLLAWSRVALKRHTMGEVIGGVVYPIMVFFLARELHLI